VGNSSSKQQVPELPPLPVNPSNSPVSSFSREKKNTTDLKQRRPEDFYFLL